MIFQCTCAHSFQDERYGKGMRLFNPRVNNKAPRCTVCGKDAKGDWAKKDKK